MPTETVRVLNVIVKADIYNYTKNMRDVKKMAETTVRALGKTTKNASAQVTSTFSRLSTSLKSGVQGFMNISKEANSASELIRKTIAHIGEKIPKSIKLPKLEMPKLSDLSWSSVWDGIKKGAQSTWDTIKSGSKTAGKIALGSFLLMAQKTPGVFKRVSSAGIAAFKLLHKSAFKVANVIGAGFASASTTAVSALSKIGGSTGRTESRTKSLIKSVGLLGAAYAAINTVRNAASNAFNRVNTIDTSVKSLTVLTQDAGKAKKVMDDLSASIEGTPIALNDVSIGAKKLVASGMNVNKIKTVFDSIADAAYGVGNGEESIDSIVHAFSQMQSASQLYLEDLNQLQDQGVPALKILANQAGVSADELKKSISDGAVDSKWAIDALVDGIHNGTKGLAGSTAAMAGLAKTAADTMEGSMANFRTSLTTTIAKALDPFKLTIIDTFKNATALMKNFRDETIGSVAVQEKLATASQVLGEIVNGLMTQTMTFSEALKRITSYIPGFDKLALAVGSLLIIDTITPLFQTFGAVASSVIPAVTAKFGGLAGGLTGILSVATSLAGVSMLGGGLLLGLGVLNEQFGEKIDEIIGTITTKVPEIVAKFSTKLAEKAPGLIKSGTDLVMKVITGINSVLPDILASAGTIVGTLIKGFVENSPRLIGGVIDVINNLAGFIADFAPVLVDQGLKLIVNLAHGIAEGLPTFMGHVTTLILGLANALMANMDSILNAGVAIISALARGIVENAPALIAKAAELITSLVNGLSVIVANHGEGFFSVALEIVTVLAASLAAQAPSLINAGFSLIAQLINAIWKAIPGLTKTLFSVFWDLGKAIGTALWEGLKEYLPRAWNGIKAGAQSLWDSVKGIFTNNTMPVSVMATPQLATASLTTMFSVQPEVTSQVAAFSAPTEQSQEPRANLGVQSAVYQPFEGKTASQKDTLSKEVIDAPSTSVYVQNTNTFDQDGVRSEINVKNADDDLIVEFSM